MAAGDLVVANYQLELRATLFGASTIYQTDPTGWKGLGSPPVKSADTQYDGQDGSAGAPDFLDVRVLTFPFEILGATPDDAFNALQDLSVAWAPARDGVNLPLYFQVPGWGKVFVNGRPRGVDDDAAQAKSSTIHALCRFDALDPTIYSGA